MAADPSRQRLLAWVDDSERHIEIDFLKCVGHNQPERKRAGRARRFAVFKHQHPAALATFRPHKAAAARKTVLGHPVRPAPVPQLVIGEAPDDRKQQRRMARPGRPRLPDEFDAGSIFERAQLGPLGLDGRGESAASDRVVSSVIPIISGKRGQKDGP